MKEGVKNLLVNIAKKNSLLRRAYRKVGHEKRAFVLESYQKKFAIDEKLIIFEAYHGKKYTCSPKAIYEELIQDERFKDFTFVWFFQNTKKFVEIKELKKAKIVDYNAYEYYEWYAKARYIVTNSIGVKVGDLKEGQTYIQTWHGTPLKRLGFDLQVKNGSSTNSLKEIEIRYGKEAEKIDYMISPSKFTTDKLISSFRLSEHGREAKVIETGYPRNDYLVTYNEEDITAIKERLGIKDCKKKIILYAPTFRDNSHEAGIGYTYELGFQIDNLKKELKEEFIILFRTHYFIDNKLDLGPHKGFVINVTDYEEINELYVISDMLITDYSSVFFDFATLKRPIIFYMYDLKEYRDDIRGFYIDISELPGTIVETEKKLIKAIKDTKDFQVDDKYKEFNNKYNYLEDGNASKRVIEECFAINTIVEPKG